MGEPILVKIETIVENSYFVTNHNIKWNDEDDNCIDVILTTEPLTDNATAKAYMNLVKKIRGSIVRGYKIRMINKFTL